MAQPLPFTEKDQFSLESYTARFGPTISSDAFEEALWYDDRLKVLPAGDPARAHFTQNRDALLAYAAVLEKRELAP